LQSETEPGYDNARAHTAVVALNDRNHISVLIRNTEISGIALSKLSGAGLKAPSSVLSIDEVPALSGVLLGRQRL
jgi:hypothetical protein